MPRTEHTSGIWALAFSPDGRELHSGSLDGTVNVWDTASGELVRTLAGHAWAVLDIDFTPDGEQVMTASRDRTIKRWNRQTGELIDTLSGHDRGVFAVEMNGEQIISASLDRTIKIWDGPTLTGHDDAVIDLAIAGGKLVSASRDRTLKVWSLDGSEIRTLTGHPSWVMKVRTVDESHVFAVSEDGTFTLWNVETGEAVWTQVGSGPIWGLDVSDDGRLAVSTGSGELTLWDLDSACETRRFNPAGSGGRAAAFSPDGRFVAGGSDDASIALFDVNTGEMSWKAPGEFRGIISGAVTPDRKTVITGHANGAVKARSLAGEDVPQFDGHGGFVYLTRPLSDTRAATAAFDGMLKIWDLTSGAELHRMRHGDLIFSLNFTTDRRRAITSGGATFRLWDLETGEAIREFHAHDEDVHAFVATSSDLRTAVFSAKSGNLEVWDLEAGERVDEITTGIDLTSALALSPDGHTCVVGTAYGSVIVCDLRERSIIAIYLPQEEWIRDLRVTPDGRYIVSVCQDGMMKVLELETGEEIETAVSDRHVPAVSIDDEGVVAAIDTRGEVHFIELGSRP